MFKKPRLKSLFSKLMVSYLVVILVTLVVLTGIMSYLVEEYFYGAREWEVNIQAREAAEMLEEPLKDGNEQELFELTQMLSMSFEAKIGVFDDEKNNLVVAAYEDEENAGGEESVQIEEQELSHVLEGNSLTKKVVGPQAERLLIAIPIYSEEEDIEDEENGFVTAFELNEEQRYNEKDFNGINMVNGNESQIFFPDAEQDKEEEREIIGIVTMNAPLVGLEDTLANISRITLISGGIAILVAGIFAITLTKKITRPLAHINSTAKALAKGEQFDQGKREEVYEEEHDELGQISKTFNLAAEEVKRTMTEQKRLAIFRKNLVDNASHEFRAPLSSIRGYSELMLEGIVPPEEQEKYLNLIWKNAVELNKMVDDLLYLSSLESGTLDIKREKLWPQEIFKAALETVMPMMTQKNQTLEMDIPYEVPVEGDRNRIKQIFVNLIRNAIEYTPENGKITLRSDYKNGYVTMQVEDTGVGIPEGEQDMIFQRFHKVDKSRNHRNGNRSTGLGLAIANELVKYHQGWIEVESEEGKGSLFIVYFPSYKDKA